MASITITYTCIARFNGKPSRGDEIFLLVEETTRRTDIALWRLSHNIAEWFSKIDAVSSVYRPK